MLPAVTPSIIGDSIFISPPKKSASDRRSIHMGVVCCRQRRGEVFEQWAIRLDRVVRPQRTRDGERLEGAPGAGRGEPCRLADVQLRDADELFELDASQRIDVRLGLAFARDGDRELARRLPAEGALTLDHLARSERKGTPRNGSSGPGRSHRHGRRMVVESLPRSTGPFRRANGRRDRCRGRGRTAGARAAGRGSRSRSHRRDRRRGDAAGARQDRAAATRLGARRRALAAEVGRHVGAPGVLVAHRDQRARGGAGQRRHDESAARRGQQRGRAAGRRRVERDRVRGVGEQPGAADRGRAAAPEPRVRVRGAQGPGRTARRRTGPTITPMPRSRSCGRRWRSPRTARAGSRAASRGRPASGPATTTRRCSSSTSTTSPQRSSTFAAGSCPGRSTSLPDGWIPGDTAARWSPTVPASIFPIAAATTVGGAQLADAARPDASGSRAVHAVPLGRRQRSAARRRDGRRAGPTRRRSSRGTPARRGRCSARSAARSSR